MHFGDIITEIETKFLYNKYKTKGGSKRRIILR